MEEIQDEQRNLHLRVSRTENQQYQDGILISELPVSEGEDLVDIKGFGCESSIDLNIELDGIG